ncbi:MAG: class I SAM-dependent methyltransferase [Planctomycetes bacterium]|nr:class I SAM-dependent methyltransferase [Planctomycetota bacterium]
MKHKTRNYPDSVHEYVRDTSLRLTPVMKKHLERNSKMPHGGGMATPPLQGQFLSFLIKSIGAKRAIEIGVFTGIGTHWIADALGPGGKVVACDVSEEFTSVGKPFWEKEGLADRIDLRLAPADKTLKELAENGETGSFDFCYIDADKGSYPKYYKLVLPLLKTGGVIAFDNMLQGGRVADPSIEDEPVATIRKLNKKLHKDKQVDVSFLPVGDGLYLARKR